MKTLSLIFITFFLASCGHVRVRTAATRMISPEAQGKSLDGSFNLKTNTNAKYRFQFQNDQTTLPLTHDETDGTLAATGELGIWKPFDVILDTTLGWGLKAQVLGDYRSEAKKGSYSVSLVGFSNSSHESEKDELFHDAGENIEKISYNFYHTSLGVIAGYRVTDPVIVYFGTHKINEHLDGGVTTKSHSLVDADVKYGNSAFLQTLGSIYHHPHTHFLIKAEASTLTTNWTRTGKRTDNGINVAVGFDW